MGDLFPANLPLNVGFGIATQFHENDGLPWLESLKSLFNKDEYVVANLESPLIGDAELSSKTCFAGSYRFADFMKDIGINAVSVANNHILEQGEEGFTSTISNLNRVGIALLGLAKRSTSLHQVIEIGGIKIGLAAFNDKHDIPNSNYYADYSVDSILNILKILNNEECAFKVLLFHWGDEYINIPSPKQIEHARLFIESGADVIVGHHPHVIQSYERYKSGYIFYSLGNFLFDMTWSENVRSGMILRLHFKHSEFAGFDITPIRLNDDFIPQILNHKFNYEKKNKNYNSQYYHFKYSIKRRINHLKERINMKMYILNNWSKLSVESKVKLQESFKKKLFDKFGR